MAFPLAGEEVTQAEVSADGPFPLAQPSKPVAIKTDTGVVQMTPHDADTLYTDKGEGVRLKGFDAAETPKVTPSGAFSAGSRLGAVQAGFMPDLMASYGFNKIKGDEKDVYKRSVAEVTGNEVEGLGRFMVKHGLATANAFTPNADVEARSYQQFHNMFNTSKERSPIDKAKELVDDTLRGGHILTPLQANTIEDYQKYKGATSNKGLQAQETAIMAMEKRLQQTDISPDVREKLSSQLSEMKDRYQTYLNIPKQLYINSLEGINHRAGGSFGELGRAFDLGLLAVKSSSDNFLQYLGDITNNKELEKYGKEQEENTKRKSALVNLLAGDVDPTGGTTTTWQDTKADPSKVFMFMGDSLLQYGPQMAAMITGSIVGGAAGGLVGGPVGAFSGSTVVPMMMGISDVYGEMPDGEKDPYLASAVGAAIGLVDMLGFAKGSIKGSQLLTKEGLESVATQVATAKGISLGDARTLVNSNIHSLGKDFALISRHVAMEQLAAKKGLVDLIGQITYHAGKEAATEAVQEALQYGSIAGATSEDFNWATMRQRVEEAAVIGGLLGGVIQTPGAMYDRSEFNQYRNMMSNTETADRTKKSLMAEQETIRLGKRMDDIELAGTLRGYTRATDQRGNDITLESLTDPKTKATVAKGLGGLFSNGGLFAQSRDNALRNFVQFPGGRMIAGLLDSNVVRGVYAGISPFKRAHMMANSVMAMMPSRTELRKMFGTDNGKDIGTLVMDSYNNGNANAAATQYRAGLDGIARQLAADVNGLGQSHGWNTYEMEHMPDYFLKNQIVDPNLVRTHRREFVDALINNFQGTPDPAYMNDLTDRITNNFSHRELKELGDMGVLSNGAFNKWRSKDLDHNTSRMVEMISRSAVRNTIFGVNGEVFAKGIKMMENAGEITRDQASELASLLLQQLEAFDGRLHKTDNALIRGATENATFATTMVYMDTSLFANLAETVYGAIGLSPRNMVKYFGVYAKGFATDVAAKFTQLGSYLTKGVIPAYDEGSFSKELDMLHYTGHYGKMNDLAFTTGANITSESKRNMSKLMFKVNLVESTTNAVRAARGAMAMDEINNLVSLIAEGGTNDTTRWARDRLEYYRVDPDKMIELYNRVGKLSEEALADLGPDTPLFQEALDSLRYGIINFIDEFSSRPEPGSTAKIFDDHRFALFTQFKKFTWHFTTNVIPQLWNMYLKRGTPQMNYSAFSMIMLSFLTAYAGMYLKDAIRGDDTGEDDEKKLNKRLQQAVNYSWGGAPMDLYKSVSEATATNKSGALRNGPIDTIVNQSAALGLVGSTVRDTYGIATKEADDKEKASMLKRIPVFGEIPGLRHYFDKEK